jgi:hypothetical protein
VSCRLRVSVELGLKNKGLVVFTGRRMTLLLGVTVVAVKRIVGAMVRTGVGEDEGICSLMVLMRKLKLRRGYVVRAWIDEQVQLI